uniref:Uncharacterized protein n=1 Tax=Sus scrofa TaxID=9823 RepID=A0A8D1VVR0_PIG
MMKSMKHIYLLLEMMIQSSLTILEMMINTMMISKLNSVFSIPSFQDDMNTGIEITISILLGSKKTWAIKSEIKG